MPDTGLDVCRGNGSARREPHNPIDSAADSEVEETALAAPIGGRQSSRGSVGAASYSRLLRTRSCGSLMCPTQEERR